MSLIGKKVLYKSYERGTDITTRLCEGIVMDKYRSQTTGDCYLIKSNTEVEHIPCQKILDVKP